MNFLFVALGGAVGATARYGISLIPSKMVFPILTFITNVLGALLIGFIVGISEKRNVSQNMILFLKTGICGGFTTFSTFSLEAFNLFEKQSYTLALVYAVLSCVFCIIGVFCGRNLAHAVL